MASAEAGMGQSVPLISILEPVPHSVVHAQPRVRWHALTDIPVDSRLRGIVQAAATDAKWTFDIDRRGDFFVPASLDKGEYRITLLVEHRGRKLRSYSVPFTVDWDRANEGRLDCVAPWRHLFVLGKNRVRPCCMLKEGVIFGTNPADADVDLWNNPGLVELRHALRTGDGRFCHPHCGALQRWGCPSTDGHKPPRDPASYERGDVFQGAPVTLKLSLGSRCNHKCTFCKMGSADYNHWDQQGYVFEYLLRNADKLQRLSLTGGEPLVHFRRHRGQIAKAFAMSDTLELLLQTNAALIDRYIDVLAAVPRLTLSVSMAGANREDYLALHRVDDFDRVCANLKAIRQARGDKPTTIEIKMVYTKRNFRGIPAFPGLAYAVGAQQVYFHHLMVLAKTDIDPADEIKETDSEYPELIAGLEAARRRADQYGVEMRVTGRDQKKVRKFNTKAVVETDSEDEDD